MVKKSVALTLLPIAVCFSSVSVLAATTAELEERLEQQEKQIKRLENRVSGTRAAVKENRSRITDASDRLKINGFFSAGAAVNDGDNMDLASYGIEDNYSTAAVSKLGIQMTFEVSDDVDVTGQLVSKGTNDYNVEAEWAYLSYAATNNLTLRVGRQRIPYYLMSEYLDVGYAYPWVRPPIEMYNIPISSTDGIALLYDMNVGSWNFSMQAYGGAGGGFSEQLEGEFILQQAWGTALFAETGSWTFRVGYNRSHLDVGDVPIGGTGYVLGAAADLQVALASGVEADAALGGLSLSIPRIDNQINGENVKTEYKSAAFMYDDGNLLVMGEIANLAVEDFAFPAGDSGYLTLGYRFGKWMPHVTFAKFYTDSESDENLRNTSEAASGVLGAYHTAIYAATFTATSGNAAASKNNADASLLAWASGADQFGNTLSYYDSMMSLQNAYNSLMQQQQSYTLGLVYDVTSRVKAKLEATHYENFGTYENITGFDTSFTGTGFTTIPSASSELRGNGRLSVDNPGGGDKHTAIYSFSIDAVF